MTSERDLSDIFSELLIALRLEANDFTSIKIVPTRAVRMIDAIAYEYEYEYESNHYYFTHHQNPLSHLFVSLTCITKIANCA